MGLSVERRDSFWRWPLRRQLARRRHPVPVRQPTRFDLIVNRKTAGAFDVDVPMAVLARADEVIE